MSLTENPDILINAKVIFKIYKEPFRMKNKVRRSGTNQLGDLGKPLSSQKVLISAQ